MNDNSFLSSSTVNLYKRNIEILEEKLKVMEKDSNEKRKRIKELIERIALMEKENEYLKTATTAESENCDMRKVIDELRKEYEEAKRINEENERLSESYGGSFAFVKTLSDAVLETNIDRSVIENLLKIVYDNIKDTIYDDALIIQGKKGFIDATKTKITSILLKQKLYKEVKDSYNEILEMLYINLILYKESI